jgi:hypothetical protein
MSFKNLEDRFNQRVDDLYAGAKLKFDGGRPSTGRNDDPLMVRAPGESRFGIRQEGRSLPFSSAPRDVIRLTLFTTSLRGLKFLAKQQLLQTGNTFEQTRLINPIFAIGNAVPFLHIRRHLRPITGQFGIAAPRDSVRNNARLLGQLQQSTYDTLEARYKAKNQTGSSANLLGRLGGKLKSLAQPFTSTLSAFTAPRDVGEKFGRSAPGVGEGWDKSRPELGTIVLEAQKANREFQDNTDKFFDEFGGGAFGFLQGIPGAEGAVLGRNTAQPFLKYFDGDTESIKTRLLGNQMNARDRADARTDKARRISYVRDPLNYPAEVPSNEVLTTYSDLPTIPRNTGLAPHDDIITVSFAMGNDDHVQFRAFINNLTQTLSPQYKPYQYVGRIEKFISYVSVERKVDFKLNVLAFSKNELSTVWKRINYLTGMVFPYGTFRGILQPNIMRFTIGNVFVDQPGYVTNMNVNFTELTDSWDIDAEVPIAATITMGISIIEKNTKTAASRFYDILPPGVEPLIGEVTPPPPSSG